MTPPDSQTTVQALWPETERLIRRLAEIMIPREMSDVEHYLKHQEYGLAVSVIADASVGCATNE